ncbi:MAG: M14 family zinc carboxypeptidase, partial [Acidobacteriota bacterium]
MRLRELTTILLLPGLLLSALLSVSAQPAQAAPFTYSTYDTMVTELESFAANFPGLAEHWTAQDLYGLPTDTDGDDELEHHILRITNEALGFDKPEVLLVGVQHGDEIVGLEVCLEIARLLLESHGTDPWLTQLVDRREIFVMPLANPHGFNNVRRWSPGTESGSEDMNRDHVYDRCEGGFCTDEVALSTVGARAIHELARRHLFRVMLDYHGGIEIIIHPWGSPIHDGNTESPDHEAHGQLGLRMQSYGGPYNGLSPVGTSSDLLGSVHGPLDDSAYASSWDMANADPTWPTDGWRALAYTIEISN